MKLIYKEDLFLLAISFNFKLIKLKIKEVSQVVVVVKNLPANAGDIKDEGSTPESARYPGKGNDNLLQYYCLENPMDRGAWHATLMGLQRAGQD